VPPPPLLSRVASTAWVLCWAALLLGGCVAPGTVRDRNTELRRDDEQVRQSGAYRCAPNELAVAEANLDFSDHELSEGHPAQALKFSEIAGQNLTKARELSKDCGPKQIVVEEPKVEVKIEEKDTDGDGVPDNVDQCPTVPGPKENNGCPYGDRDNDGIPDNLDLCPDVPGIPEEHGCPRKYTLLIVKNDQIVIKQQVHFATNKWVILPDSYALLGEVALVLKDNPQMRVLVEGHTDSVGSLKKNMVLSQKRAESVVEFLVNLGIDPNRLESKGMGPTRPIASNSSAVGRAQNRRVEFHILNPAPALSPAVPPPGSAPLSTPPGWSR
jgi:outer membrane protein OmpA-like peptidoglycan-associated protein